MIEELLASRRGLGIASLSQLAVPISILHVVTSVIGMYQLLSRWQSFVCDSVCLYIMSYVLNVLYAHTHRLEEGPDQYTGVKNGDIIITYRMIQQDVRTAINWSHIEVYRLLFVLITLSLSPSL